MPSLSVSRSAVDSAALPPVPPAAPDTHPRRDRLVIGSFAIVLALGLGGAIVNRGTTALHFENRAAAPWPAPPDSIATLRAWPAALERAFADRFGGRDRLIALHHLEQAVVFGVSPVANVVIGRDGWLFFLGEDGKSIDRDFRGVAPYPAGEAQAIAAEFKRRHDWLAARGIAYAALVVPDKATIYPEHLPAWIVRARQTRLDRLYAALAAYPEVLVLDVRPALVAAKAGGRQYFLTDSHWNLLGAATAYKALSAALKARVPAYPGAPATMPPHAPGVDHYSGDLAQMLGVPRWFREDDVAPLAKVLAEPWRRCARRTDDATDATREEWECGTPGLPSAVVYRDSMAIPLLPLWSENFRRVIYVSGHALDPALIERVRPDVVIEEMVERMQHAPLAEPVR